MDVVRRYVFPVIWMLILGLIAASLVKMAFFSTDDALAGNDLETPTAEFDEFALVAVETGEISSELVLSALVEPDPGTALEATTDGEINRIWRTTGDTVGKGERVLQVRYPVEAAVPEPPILDPSADGTGDAPEASAPPVPAATEYRYVTLVTTAAGTLTDMELREGDTLAKGDPVATISPGTYSIVADLTPEQQLSLLDLELKATAKLPNSSDPVACTAPAITEDAELEEPEAPAAPQVDPFTGMEIPGESTISAAQLRCPVPAEARVVPGLAVDVTVDLGTRTGVLTVPTTAVLGDGTAGTVYTLDPATGETVEVPVILGMRAEGSIEVTDGLEAGQEILQFAPGVDGEDMGMMDGGVW